MPLINPSRARWELTEAVCMRHACLRTRLTDHDLLVSECLSNISFWWVWFIIAQSHLWESLWEIDLICLVSIYVIYYLFHVMWISIIPIKYATIMVFFFQINLYFILVLVNFMLLSFFVNCVKLICVIKNGIKLLTLIPRQYKWLSRVFYPIF